MQKLLQYLEAIYPADGRSFYILETNCALTYKLSEWASDHPKTVLNSVSLDWGLQHAAHQELERAGLAKYCTFHSQIPSKFLTNINWIDVVILSPRNLQEGKEQFALAASAGASLVIINGYQSTAALAVEEAKSLGWKISYEGTYSVLQR